MSDAPLRVLAIDVHGVLLSGDRNDQVAFARRLRLSDEAWLRVRQTVLDEEDGWSRVERGEASLAEFSARLAAAVTDAGGTCDDATAAEIWGAPNPFHSSVPRRRLAGALTALRERGVHIVLVTNNIREWRTAWQAVLPRDLPVDHVVDSSAVGVRKPEARFWRIVEELTGARPGEIVLVDDRPETVAAAVAHGWRGVVYTDEIDCVNRITMLAARAGLDQDTKGGQMRAEDAVLAAARAKRRPDGAVVVAIDGRSASGKSTLGERLGEHADVAVLHMDDFYRVADQAGRERWTPEQGVDLYFDWQRLRDEALVPLRAGRAATFRVYDWDADAYGPEVTIAPRPVVVVEGVYSTRPELRHLVDVAVFVDTPLDVCVARQHARNQSPGPQILRWRAAEDVYFGSLGSEFDLIVSGNDHVDEDAAS